MAADHTKAVGGQLRRPALLRLRRTMKPQEEITLHLESLDQLIEPCAPSPFLKRRLRKETEEFIIEQAMALPRNSAAKLIIYLPENEAAEVLEVSEAFHRHFAFRRDEAERELRRIRRFGGRSLLIGFVFLGLMMLLVEIIKRYIPAGNLVSVIQEGLTILAWVALWRPGELLLYEWRPFKRDAKLFGRLECAEIKVIAKTKERADEPRSYSAKSDNRLSTAG
jgi:hypothetical protein